MLDEIICGNNLDLIPKIADNSVHAVITSPPYNVDLGNNKFNKNKYDTYEDNKDYWDYIEWLKSIFKALYPKLVTGGRVVINIGDAKNGSIPTHCDIEHFMVNELGYIPITTIIWNKNQMAGRTSWGSFMSPSCPSFPTPFEYVMVFAKEQKKLVSDNTETDLDKDEFILWANALWSFAPETRMKEFGHPAMYPEEMAKRCIKMFTYVGDTVVDIFNGAGTTCKVAKDLGRHYIGFDISEDYCKTARERISPDYYELF